MHTKNKSIIFFTLMLFLCACGKNKTAWLLENKHWKVYNVTPPATGTFDIDAANEAEELKNGFYKNAQFEFVSNGIYRTTFGGKIDSGKFKINYDGKIISLYPLHGNKMYEQIQLQKLTDNEMNFNTLIADFYMTLNLKSSP